MDAAQKMELKQNYNVIINENFRASNDRYPEELHPDVVMIKKSTEKNGMSNGNGTTNVEAQEEPEAPSTSYVETMMHLFKGNVGPGCFAMADAVKNGGLLLAPVLTLFLGIFCVHSQHILLNCSAKMKARYQLTTKPDYAETVELCFASSDSERWRKFAPVMKRICNIFICITQLGFCCIYILFFGTNLKQVLDFYGFKIDIPILITIVMIPVWLSALITNLKYLAPCSAIANACMITGLVISYYYAAQDLPPITERNFWPTDYQRVPLFFGTAIFAFEGIALVLPLQNAMENPKSFSRYLGVLNVSMVFITGIFISFGAIGYWKYGEDIEGSLTLNLPTDEILAQCVKLAIALGVLLGYAIQFFVAVQIMFPSIRSSFKFADSHPLLGELLFRTSMVMVTFVIAQLVPNLSLLLSLIGAVCSTVLALVLPPLIEFIILSSGSDGIGWYVISKNSTILLISLLGFLTGGYESLSNIVKAYL